MRAVTTARMLRQQQQNERTELLLSKIRAEYARERKAIEEVVRKRLLQEDKLASTSLAMQNQGAKEKLYQRAGTQQHDAPVRSLLCCCLFYQRRATAPCGKQGSFNPLWVRGSGYMRGFLSAVACSPPARCFSGYNTRAGLRCMRCAVYVLLPQSPQLPLRPRAQRTPRNSRA